jgi:hypothetical protein
MERKNDGKRKGYCILLFACSIDTGGCKLTKFLKDTGAANSRAGGNFIEAAPQSCSDWPCDH